MQRLASYLQRRGTGTFHLRIVVPNDLQPYLKQREIKRSLATKDPATAFVLAQNLKKAIVHAFGECRSMAKKKEPVIHAVWLRLSHTDGSSQSIRIERDDPEEEARIGERLLGQLQSLTAKPQPAAPSQRCCLPSLKTM